MLVGELLKHRCNTDTENATSWSEVSEHKKLYISLSDRLLGVSWLECFPALEGKRRNRNIHLLHETKRSICSKNVGKSVFLVFCMYILCLHIMSCTVLYTCCCDGRAKENLLPKKTTQTRKHCGSRKLEEEYCISRMTVVKKKDGKVSARYIRTHTHHTPGIGEVKHLPLSQGVKQKVREKYGQNWVGFDSRWCDSNAKRLVLIYYAFLLCPVCRQ